MLPFIIARLREPSTYAGVAAVLLAFHIGIPDSLQAAIPQFGIALAGLLAAIVEEKGVA